jgi:hypothetical protein
LINHLRAYRLHARRPTLRQADQARTDFAIIEDELVSTSTLARSSDWQNAGTGV